jgi:hypothetical protein
MEKLPEASVVTAELNKGVALDPYPVAPAA